MTRVTNLEVDFVFDVDDEADRNQLAGLIEQRLVALDGVTEVEAKATEERITGVEIVAAIGVTVLIIKGSRMAVHEMRLLLQEVKLLIHDIKGLKSASIEIEGKQIPTDEVDDKAIQDFLAKVQLMEGQ
jgi:hypothetical protein